MTMGAFVQIVELKGSLDLFRERRGGSGSTVGAKRPAEDASDAPLPKKARQNAPATEVIKISSHETAPRLRLAPAADPLDSLPLYRPPSKGSGTYTTAPSASGHPHRQGPQARLLPRISRGQERSFFISLLHRYAGCIPLCLHVYLLRSNVLWSASTASSHRPQLQSVREKSRKRKKERRGPAQAGTDAGCDPVSPRGSGKTAESHPQTILRPGITLALGARDPKQSGVGISPLHQLSADLALAFLGTSLALGLRISQLFRGLEGSRHGKRPLGYPLSQRAAHFKAQTLRISGFHCESILRPPLCMKNRGSIGTTIPISQYYSRRRASCQQLKLLMSDIGHPVNFNPAHTERHQTTPNLTHFQ
ncbi:hypothetical protein DFH09DRAFT_1386870 [Mycena vulgaris]|nr:hypothetical protein DFH09DRAFT_1386870 [Mycena vulgaris]